MADSSGLIGGNSSRRLSDVRSGLRIDTEQLTKLNSALKTAMETTKSWRQEMEKLAKAAKDAHQSMTGGSGPTPPNNWGPPTGPPRNPNFSNVPTPPPTPPSATATSLGSSMTRGLGVAAAVTNVVAPVIGGAVRQMDQRIDRGIQYATSADRLSVLTQQMTGMSQRDVMNQMRRPMENYRLGMGGINEMMAFQAHTGIQMNAGMAQSIAGIRASTGYSKSTGDILTEQQQLMDPQVANRMFFMGGVNAFKIGGGMKDPLQMRQEIIQRMGLDNPSVARSALQPGSVTRARMADLGLGEEMQTEILQYAQQQVAYKEKGGKGFYDPSKAQHRQMMGIEDNLATQQEETERVTTVREETFMRNQIENMAALEKSNQALIAALQSLETSLSGLIGARTRTRPQQKVAGGALKGLGGALMAGGAMTSASVAGAAAGVPMMALGAVAYGIGSMLGDPTDADSDGLVPPAQSMPNRRNSNMDDHIMVPYGYSGNRISLTELKSKADFNKLHPTFKGRLLEMMRVNPNLGVGGGTRDTAMQEKMFLSRYTPTNEETEIFWRGKYWKHTSGAAAAPPGRSYHEIGLAADLIGDLDWMNANAEKFGLRHFADVNDEPWHVQPNELPGSRSKYEEQGAPWGTDGEYQRQGSVEGTTSRSATGRGRSSGGHSSSSQPSGIGGGGLPQLGGMSIQEAMAAARSSSLTRMLASRGSGGGASSWSSPRSGSSSTGSGRPAGNRKLTPKEVAQYAYNAGFRGDDLIKAVAIAGAESGFNTGALNPNGKDNSFGLMQMNMYGDLGPSRREQWGLSSDEELYDPATNMRAAYSLYSSTKGFSHWTTFTGGKYNDYMDQARTAVTSMNLGDPVSFGDSPSRAVVPAGSAGGGTMHYTSSPTINVAPVINFNGAPSTPDLRNIAATVSRMIKQEVDMLDLRTS